MKINQYLGQRLAIVATIVLSVFLIFTISQATLNISHEKTAVANLLVLSEKIESLKNSPKYLFDQKLNEVITFIESAEFRHIHIKVKNKTGQVIVDVENEPQINNLGLFVGKLISQIHAFFKDSFEEQEKLHSISVTNQSQNFIFEITPNSLSEQSEAGTLLLTAMAMLASLTGLIYLGMKFTLRKALNPLKDALFQLQKLSHNEYEGILERSEIQEVREVNDAINTLSQSLIDLEKSRQMLSAKLISTQEDERARISRELHDELGQKIAVIRFNTSFLEKSLDPQSSAFQAITDIKSAIKDIDLEVKTLLKSLRPDQSFLELNNVSLKKLLIDLIKTWQDASGQTANFNYEIELGDEDFSAEINLILFRITQEALTNIAKHAHAKNIDIQIIYKNKMINWSVIDDGVGLQQFDSKCSRQKGNGLAGLQERLWSIGGELIINSDLKPTNTGFELKAKIPVN
jgi:two-component system sensor histidine kinase UhpB